MLQSFSSPPHNKRLTSIQLIQFNTVKFTHKLGKFPKSILQKTSLKVCLKTTADIDEVVDFLTSNN